VSARQDAHGVQGSGVVIHRKMALRLGYE
jgi:hypothetical protein